MKKVKYDGVIFLSGGLDSMVLAHSLVSDGRRLRALHFATGRYSSAQELNVAKRLSLDLDLPLEVVDFTGIQQMMRGLMPVDVAIMGEWDMPCQVEITAFPILLGAGIYYSQMITTTQLYIGVLAEQVADRPHIDDYYRLTSEASGYIDRRFPAIKIVTPFLKKSKKQVIQAGDKLKVPMHESWSCWRGGSHHCGICPACKSRMQAFADTGVRDKTVYENAAA
jgi:7-cyano-7-deazaguanine synthase